MAAPRYAVRSLGVLNDVPAVQVGGAGSANAIPALNASGVLDPSMLGAGIGDDLVTAPASEAITGPALISLWSNSGAASVRNADSATAGAAKAVDGFVLGSVASGASATYYSHGLMTGFTGLTPGVMYYLGPAGTVVTASAASVANPPSGTTVQQIGKAVSATAIDVQPQPPIAVQ